MVQTQCGTNPAPPPSQLPPPRHTYLVYAVLAYYSINFSENLNPPLITDQTETNKHEII
jgi:hypothetical protein